MFKCFFALILGFVFVNGCASSNKICDDLQRRLSYLEENQRNLNREVDEVLLDALATIHLSGGGGAGVYEYRPQSGIFGLVKLDLPPTKSNLLFVIMTKELQDPDGGVSWCKYQTYIWEIRSSKPHRRDDYYFTVDGPRPPCDAIKHIGRFQFGYVSPPEDGSVRYGPNESPIIR